MTARRKLLLQRLAGGRAFSVGALARELGGSLESLHEDLETLRSCGLEVEPRPGGSVRLRSRFDLLDRDAMLCELGPDSRRRLEALDLLFEVGSTNQFLLDLARDGEPAAPRACLVEVQSAGRGRGGRPFLSALGGSVLLSLLWPLDSPPADLPGLSPAIAIAVARALESEDVDGVGLKWPNDVLVGGRKVCGILLELGADRRERRVLVAGIGINIRLSASTGGAIDQPWTDLHCALGRTPSRNRVAGRVIDHVMQTVRVYLQEGFAPFRAEYRARDVLAGRELCLVQGAVEFRGTARGLDERGALLVEAEGRLDAFLSGEVRVRRAA